MKARARSRKKRNGKEEKQKKKRDEVVTVKESWSQACNFIVVSFAYRVTDRDFRLSFFSFFLFLFLGGNRGRWSTMGSNPEQQWVHFS
jgi:hypothetical protein